VHNSLPKLHCSLILCKIVPPKTRISAPETPMARGRELSQSGNLEDRPAAGIPVSGPLLRAAERAWRAAQRGRLTLAEGQDCARPQCSRRGLKRHSPSRSCLCPGVPVPDSVFYLMADPDQSFAITKRDFFTFPSSLFLRKLTFTFSK
jgi:hypothetical protein